VDDVVTGHGDPQALLAEMGLDAAGIEAAIKAYSLRGNPLG
jgi:deoxyxylulose-5-phosphate synthase